MRLTREALHRLVWSQPMPQAARTLGLTRAALEKHCEALAVPYPFSGFWHGGAPLDATPRALPTPPPGVPDAVEIQGPSSEVSALDQAPSPPSARVEQDGDLARAPEAPAGSPGAAAPRAKRAASVRTGLHPIIAARVQEDRRLDAMTAPRGKPPPARPVGRWRRLEGQMFHALEAAGHVVVLERQSLYDVWLKVEGQAVTYRLRERYTRTRRPLTAEEAHDPWNVRLGRTHAFDNVMTGELVLAAQTRAYGRKAEWRDRPEARLEAQMAAIVQGLEALAREATRVEAERREAEARWRREEERRAEAERRAQAEEDRWERLVAAADTHAQARRVATLLQRLQATCDAHGDADPAFRRWFAWAWRELAARDPLAWGPAEIIAEVDGAERPGGDDDA